MKHFQPSFSVRFFFQTPFKANMSFTIIFSFTLNQEVDRCSIHHRVSFKFHFSSQILNVIENYCMFHRSISLLETLVNDHQ